MALTINTNISSIIAQRSLNNATNSMNTSLERMSTGYQINHAKDNAAGYSIANSWETKLGSLDVAADNAATGLDLLTTAEETYGLLTSHLQRVRDLTEQAANGTYGSQSLKAIQSEIVARLQEVNRLSANSEFNGIKLMAFDMQDSTKNAEVGITGAGVNLQVGLYADENSTINLKVDLFAKANVSGLFNKMMNTVYNKGADLNSTTDDKTLKTALRNFKKKYVHLKFANEWKKFIITSEPELEHYFGARADKKRKFYNGKIKCDYYMFTDNSRKGKKK